MLGVQTVGLTMENSLICLNSILSEVLFYMQFSHVILKCRCREYCIYGCNTIMRIADPNISSYVIRPTKINHLSVDCVKLNFG